jgi:hypothetical protein
VAWELDGIPLNDRLTRLFTTNLSIVGAQNIEVYTGGLSDQYGNAAAGVINSLIKRESYPGFASVTYTSQLPVSEHDIVPNSVARRAMGDSRGAAVQITAMPTISSRTGTPVTAFCKHQLLAIRTRPPFVPAASIGNIQGLCSTPIVMVQRPIQVEDAWAARAGCSRTQPPRSCAEVRRRAFLARMITKLAYALLGKYLYRNMPYLDSRHGTERRRAENIGLSVFGLAPCSYGRDRPLLGMASRALPQRYYDESNCDETGDRDFQSHERGTGLKETATKCGDIERLSHLRIIARRTSASLAKGCESAVTIT